MKSVRQRNLSRHKQPPHDDSGSSAGKRTPTPAGPPEEWRLEAAVVSLLTLTDDDNRLICPPFRVLPTPQEFPLYYEHIKQPIDLKRIAENIRNGKYITWHALESDIELMCNNAKQFNENGSMVHKDAGRLLQHFRAKIQELTEAKRFSQRIMAKNKEIIDELLRSTSSEMDEYSEDSEEDEDSEQSLDARWRLYWTIRNFDVVDGVPLCENFMELPSIRSYPDYYEEIEHPLSLYMVNKKLKRGQYADLNALVQDLLLMFENACSYNIEGSEIYTAAIRLKQVTLQTSRELEPNFRPRKRSSSFKTEPISVKIEVEGGINGTTAAYPPAVIKRRRMAVLVPSPRLAAAKHENLTLKSKANKQTENRKISTTDDHKNDAVVDDDQLTKIEETLEDSQQSSNSKETIEVEAGTAENTAEKGMESPIAAQAIPKRQRPPKMNSDGTPMEKQKPGRKSVDELRDRFAKVLMDVWTDVRELKIGERVLSEPFLYLPCDKTYPDYYNSIKNPISMTCIKDKIQDQKYSDSDETLKDLKLMFQNARTYNKSTSQIFTDSTILESVAISSLQSRTHGTTVFFPYRRSDKGWTEQASIEKSPLKSKKKGSNATNAANSASLTSAAADRNCPSTSASAGPQPMTTPPPAMEFAGAGMVPASSMAVAPSAVFPHHFQPHPLNPGVFIAAGPVPFPLVSDGMFGQTAAVVVAAPPPPLFPGSPASSTTTTNFNNKSAKNQQQPTNAYASCPSLPRKQSTEQPLAALELSKLIKSREHLSREHRQMYAIMEATLTYRDDEDRLLSEQFVKLPSREDYKEYYRIIRNPIDLTKIVNKLVGQQYDHWRLFMAELRLVFENACRFNEPESEIYQDAVILLREVTGMRTQLFQEHDLVGSVQAMVRQILKQLLDFICNYKDARDRRLCDSVFLTYGQLEQRVRSNSINSVASTSSSNNSEMPFSLDQLRDNIERGLYRRLDRFQDDLFALFTRTREIVEVDSEVFTDLVELQHQFIAKREAICKGVLRSPASLYTMSLLEEELAQLRKDKEKLTKAQQKGGKSGDMNTDERILQNGEMKARKELIQLLEVQEMDDLAEGCKKQTKEGDEKEEQKMEVDNLEEGTQKPEEADEGSATAASNSSRPPSVLDVHREEVLDKRQALTNQCSVGSNGSSGGDYVGHDSSNVYYQQMEHNGRFYRLGDGVLVYREGKPYCEVMRIDRMWKTESGEKMFSGCRFARPCELKHEPSRMFYKQEVVAVIAVDCMERMTNVQGLCAVLPLKQYETSRPTEIPECDVFVVEQKVLGPSTLDNSNSRITLTWKNCSVIAARGGPSDQKDDDLFGDQQELDLDNARTIRKLRQYNLAREVIEDEVFYFKQPLMMEKVLSQRVMNPNSSDHALPITHSELDGEAQLLTRQQRQHRMVRSSEDDPNLMMMVVDEEIDVDGEEEEEEMEEEDDDDQSGFRSRNSTFGNNFNHRLHAGRSQQSLSSNIPPPAYANLNQQVAQQQQQTKFQQTITEGKRTNEHNYGTPQASSSVQQSPSLLTTPTSRARKNGSKQGASWLATQPKLNAKSKSGYILFSAEVRKRVMNENPDANFGEVSKMVGIEWKRLSDEQKRQYETRAQYIAEERAKAELLTPNSKLPQPGQIRVHCCRWQQCDFQFDSQEGLYEHVRSSHTSQIVDEDNLFVCLWNSCLKYRKEGKPFPTLPRLNRHIKDKHLTASIRLMFPNQRSKNYFVYYAPQSSLSNGPSSSSKNAQTDDSGQFVHHPFGEVPTNAVACSVATPFYSTSNSSINATSIGSHRPGSSSSFSQSAATHSGYQPGGTSSFRFVTTNSSAAKSGYAGGQLLNGAIAPATLGHNAAASSTSTHHYVVQQQQQQPGSHVQTVQQRQIHHHHAIPQQTVVIPAGQQAIVVNGMTVYIPANAQTVILPPGYTGPQQQHQIVVHTQQQHAIAQPIPPNGPSSSSTSSSATHFVTHHQPQQIIVQQTAPHSLAGPYSQQQSLAGTQMANGSAVNSHSSLPSVPASVSTVVHTSLPSGSTSMMASAATNASVQHHHQHVAAALAHQPSTSATSLHQQHAAALQHSQVHTGQHASSVAVQHQQPMLIDPGRTVVSATKPPEPIFVPPTGSLQVKRGLHSEAYIKYIETLQNGKQRNVSKWDKSLLASHKNMTANKKKLRPYDWVKLEANGSKPKEEELVRALFRLRDHMIEETVGVARIGEGESSKFVETSAPQVPDPAIAGSSQTGPSGSNKKS